MDEPKQQLKTKGAKPEKRDQKMQNRKNFSAPSNACFYTFSCKISHMLLVTGLKSGEFRGYSLGGINSGDSFCNNSIHNKDFKFYKVV